MPADTWSSNATITRLYGLLARSVGPHVNKIHGNGSMVAEMKPKVLRAQAPVSPWNTVMRLASPAVWHLELLTLYYDQWKYGSEYQAERSGGG